MEEFGEAPEKVTPGEGERAQRPTPFIGQYAGFGRLLSSTS
jgi:hypothetical protein